MRENTVRKLFVPVCVATALFFAGCGIKCKKKAKKEEVSYEMSEEAQKVAVNQEIPIYQSGDERVYDFDEGDVEEYVFVTDDNKRKEEGPVVAQVADFGEDEWEDEDLKLAWEDEKVSEEPCDFKVVQFDLNKNSIRDDQKLAIEENVKLAENAAKTGKKFVVAGHCCELGSASYNMSLSERRAKTIRDEMVKGGVSKDKITILGCGSEHPVVLSDSQDRATRIKDLEANRRAEISIH